MLKCVNSDKPNNKTSMVKSDSVLREMCSCSSLFIWYAVGKDVDDTAVWAFEKPHVVSISLVFPLHLSSGARLLVLSMALGDWFDQYWILLYQGRLQEDDFEQRKKLVCLLYE